MMKKGIILLTVCLMLFSGALADPAGMTELSLPGNHFSIWIPDNMRYDAPGHNDSALFAWVSDTLELDVFCYENEGKPLSEIAKQLAQQGETVEMRRVNTVDLLCYQAVDEVDEAPCIGFVFIDGDQVLELVFWYADQKAADQITAIMDTLH